MLAESEGEAVVGANVESRDVALAAHDPLQTARPQGDANDLAVPGVLHHEVQE